jgi:hypothetical protein
MQLYQYYNSADEFALPPLWVKDAQKVSWNEVSPTNTVGPWNTCYNNLGQCHIFLKELDELNPNGVTEDDKTRWKAEVKFCEAFYHFTLLNAYGPIPLVTKYYSQNTATSDFPGRSPYDVCVDSISNWFDEAAKNLPATVQEDELGRATSTACKALKARLLVMRLLHYGMVLSLIRVGKTRMVRSWSVIPMMPISGNGHWKPAMMPLPGRQRKEKDPFLIWRHQSQLERMKMYLCQL